MKTLILVRHAKSEWPENAEDFHRPLAEKGAKTAEKMAQFLLNEEVEINQMITSAALRAKSTCAIFSKAFALPYSETRELYHASGKQFLEVIANADEAASTLALFSHNNGILDFANSLSGDQIQFKTCAVAIFQINTDSWTDFNNAPKKLKNYFTPKNNIK